MRRLLRFRLKTLLILVALLSVALGHWSSKSNRQRRAVEWINGHGGEALYEGQLLPAGGVPHVPSVTGWRAWLGADYFHRVVDVRVPDEITDDELPILLDLPDTQFLNLAYCGNISDEGVAVLPGLRKLEVLWLYRNDVADLDGSRRKDTERITDEALRHVGQVSTLRELGLWDNFLTDEGLAHLRCLHHLERLGIRSDGYTEQGVARLQEAIPSCKIDWDRQPVGPPLGN